MMALAVPANFWIILVFWIIAFAVWIWALVDALLSRKDTNEKLIWVLVIIFTHFIGAIIYFIIVKGMRKSITR